MSEQHTPEPWALFEANTPGLGETIVVGGSSDEVGTFQPGVCIITDKASANPRDYANARRIVACVNACRGMSTEDLEKHTGALTIKNVVNHLEHEYERRSIERDLATKERDEARAIVAELAAELRKCEWDGSSMGEMDSTCPWCLADKFGKGHHPDCELDTMLKRAEALRA